MAKIATYPIASPVAPDDMVIGTSTESEFPLQTKNFRVSDINSLASTPIPVAQFTNVSVSPIVIQNATLTQLAFPRTDILDETGDIVSLNGGTKFKLNSGGVYSFELRHHGYSRFNEIPNDYEITYYQWFNIKNIDGISYDGYYTSFINPLSKAAIVGFNSPVSTFMSWTKVYLPTQEVDLKTKIQADPFGFMPPPPGVYDWVFQTQCDDLNVCTPALSLTIKRYRKLTVEELLKYAEAVGLTGGGNNNVP